MYPETLTLPFRQIHNTVNSFPEFEGDSDIAEIERVDVLVYGPTNAGCCNSTPSLVAVWTSADVYDEFTNVPHDLVKLNSLEVKENGFAFYDWYVDLQPGAYKASVQFTMQRNDAQITISMFELKFKVSIT